MADLKEVPEGVKAVKRGAEQWGIEVELIDVESDYYEWSLEKRMQRLNAPSIHCLCKTLILHNSRFKERPELGVESYSQYYCILVQYSTPLNTQKLNNFVQSLSGLPKKGFNMRCRKYLSY